MFNLLIRVKTRRAIALVATIIILTLALPARSAFATPPTLSNVQFHIGCSSFSASADATNGFGFLLFFNNAFIVEDGNTGTGHITLGKSYGKTFPQGTLLLFVTVDNKNPVDVGTVACSDDGFQGPGIPAGFVLQTITCNTPVYTNPDGTPSGVNAITAGQTWYVNPVPVKDAKGNSWTEVFVSSYNDPFIPTSCLGGAPAK